MKNHYDNLKVSQTAPIEVIRAAYRALTKKNHPDHNLGNPDSHRVMTLINEAYDVLSDPIKRNKHDQWIQNENKKSNTSNVNEEVLKKKEKELFEEKKLMKEKELFFYNKQYNWEEKEKKYIEQINFLKKKESTFDYKVAFFGIIITYWFGLVGLLRSLLL